jgi:hypothetical protein
MTTYENIPQKYGLPPLQNNGAVDLRKLRDSLYKYNFGRN